MLVLWSPFHLVLCKQDTLHVQQQNNKPHQLHHNLMIQVGQLQFDIGLSCQPHCQSPVHIFADENNIGISAAQVRMDRENDGHAIESRGKTNIEVM